MTDYAVANTSVTEVRGDPSDYSGNIGNRNVEHFPSCSDRAIVLRLQLACVGCSEFRFTVVIDRDVRDRREWPLP